MGVDLFDKLGFKVYDPTGTPVYKVDMVNLYRFGEITTFFHIAPLLTLRSNRFHSDFVPSEIKGTVSSRSEQTFGQGMESVS